MANEEHMAILRQGVEVWNEWREKHREVQPDLTEAQLKDAILHAADLRGADLRQVYLGGADLNSAILYEADLSGANVHGADLSNTYMAFTTLVHVDLSNVKGLDTVKIGGPVTLSVNTLLRTADKIPETFLRGCGVPQSLIDYLPSILGSMEPIQFYSCFISYSSEDNEFAKRLHGRMQQEHLRVWFAPEDMKAGEKLYEQIDRAIQLQDRLLVVLSRDSINSKWVDTEIRRARRAELREKRRKLFPIRLVSYEELQEWECFDADAGEDLAAEIRKYYIPDFSNWKDHDSFEAAFRNLLRDLRAMESTMPQR